MKKFFYILILITLYTFSLSGLEKKNKPMNNVEKEVWNTVKSINSTWVKKKDALGLKKYFHKNMVLIEPSIKNRQEGRKIIIEGYKNFISSIKLISINEIDPKIQLYGDNNFAVVTYYYNLKVQIKEKIEVLKGRDMYVFVKENKRWQAVANQFSAFPKK